MAPSKRHVPFRTLAPKINIDLDLKDFMLKPPDAMPLDMKVIGPWLGKRSWALGLTGEVSESARFLGALRGWNSEFLSGGLISPSGQILRSWVEVSMRCVLVCNVPGRCGAEG